MTRNRNGWLRAESLIAGEREQYAVKRSYGTVVVQLRFNPEETPLGVQQWVTSITITSPTNGVEHIEYRSFRLNAARDKFNELARQHP